jgi:3-oxoacyl-(acyl-carrier-protein) synthase
MRQSDENLAFARRVVVTGIGVVAPNGIGREDFWRSSREGHRAVTPLRRFDAAGYGCRIAGQVEGFRAEELIARNVLKQTDRSTHMALAACRLATEDAGLDLAREAPERVGMYFANVFGGMEFAENELWTQSFVGPERVSAYQSIAWFFAATQGQWSIATGIKGFGKSIVADRAGGHQALLLGAMAIRHGHADVVYAGGFEAPLVPYVFRIHESTGLLSADRGAPEAAYRPFDAARSGLVLAEGSAVLVLEEVGRALARGARIYGEIAGGAMTFDGPDAGSEALERCLLSAVASSGLDPREVDCVLPEGLAVAAADHREAAAISRVFGRGAVVSLPKARTGHALAAAGALDAAWALLMISHGVFLAPVNCDRPDAGELSLARSSQEGEGPAVVLCFGRGYGGVSSALALRKFETCREAA